MFKKIALDMDGVLVGLKSIDIASELLGYDYKEEHATDWYMRCFPEELRLKILNLFSDPVTMCDKVKIIPESQKMVRKWYDKGYKLEVVTARVEPIRLKTVELISSHFPEVQAVHFVNFNESKNEILKKIAPNLFVDDSPSNVSGAIEIGINTIMVSNKFTKYNHFLRDKVKWVNNLTEIEI